MNNEDFIFEKCKHINTLLLENQEEEARDNVIKLLDYHSKANIEYSAKGLKELICLYDAISFDIFDTLVVRPFYKPTDLFKMMDREYRLLVNSNTLKINSLL